MQKGAVGPYQLQAAIAALHDEARSVEETDWPQILALYSLLARMADNPVVALNRAVAVAMVDGPAAGLALVDRLAASGDLSGYHLLPATRADLLRRMGDSEHAAEAYREALALAATDAERAYLMGRLDEL
jgi:RNA polymerase sigma-70 factor (ECF subfamily)